MALSLSIPPVAFTPKYPTSPAPTPQPWSKYGKLRDITDGTSNTLMMGETDFAPLGVPSSTYGAVWSYGYMYNIGSTGRGAADWESTGMESVQLHRINGQKRGGSSTTLFGAYRSQHPGGAMFAMGDGVVRMISENIDFGLYNNLATRSGNEPTGQF